LKAGDTAAAKLVLQDIENNGVIFEFSASACRWLAPWTTCGSLSPS